MGCWWRWGWWWLAAQCAAARGWDSQRSNCLSAEDRYSPTFSYMLFGGGNRQRRTFVLERNGWDSQGDRVLSFVPSCFAPSPRALRSSP